MTLAVGKPRVALAGDWWARGLNLAERMANAPEPATPGVAGADSEESARQVRRLERWRTAHGMPPESFARRLATLGLEDRRLLTLLSEPTSAVAARTARPAWADTVEEVLRELPPVDGEAHTSWQDRIATIVAPFLAPAASRLEAATQQHVYQQAVNAEALRRIHGTLIELAARTLVLELNVLRVTGRLVGETPEQRFDSFVRHYRQAGNLASLFEEYPVLARLLVEEADRRATAHLELLARFAADRPALVECLCDGVDPGDVVSIEAAGDAHGGGRTVALLRFASGVNVVYKPRPLAVHAHFNEAIGWLNGLVAGLDLQTLRVIERDGYGWMEFAAYQPCPDEEAVARYYNRQGALLALLYVLDGADFHFENLIACGDQPVLLDVEALLHPRVRTDRVLTGSDDPAVRALSCSVDRLGLLPRLIVGENGAVDISGLGGDKGAVLPMNMPGWSGSGTDEMRLVRQPGVLAGGQNRPGIGTVDADPAQYAGSLLAGFGEAYDAIAEHRDELREPHGLLRRFAGDDIRVMLRPSRCYGEVLAESTHPDVLRDALDRDRLFDYIWAASLQDPTRERATPLELAEMWNGDIPLFTGRPDSTDLRASTGDTLPGVLEEPSLERVRRKLAQLGAEDRERQEWIVTASMVARARPLFGSDPAAASGAGSGGGSDDGLDPQRLVSAARGIADEIVRRRYDDGDRVNWLGLDLVDEKYWMLTPLATGLYGGHPGVALFLAQVGALTGDESYLDIARRAVRALPAFVAEKAAGSPIGLSAFAGPAGVAYALTHLAVLLDEPDLADPVSAAVELCGKAVGDDEAFDIIGGSAGCLAAMLAIAEAGVPGAAEVADACARRLVETADEVGNGVAWLTNVGGPEKVHLTGFSHGAAGIGWALARYALVTGEKRYADLAASAFRFEHNGYDAAIADWPDRRVGQGDKVSPPSRMIAWCHGSPGIGLARADLLRRLTSADHVFDPEVAALAAEDLDRALKCVVDVGQVDNHSLCHGELGNLELLSAALTLGRYDVAEHRASRARVALSQIEGGSPRCGIPGTVPSPGLLNGLAGIGHGLLRLAYPHRVASVLLLERPGAVVSAR